ncbi:MAG: hypothetical protein AB7S78_13425 [Candidatus Omnitrophota bacterium]
MENRLNLKGTVTEFYPTRGYGYLCDELRAEYCFYTNDITTGNRSVNKGDQFNFDIYVGHGVRAVNLRNLP